MEDGEDEVRVLETRVLLDRHTRAGERQADDAVEEIEINERTP